MLSLKKAATGPRGVWSLQTMNNSSWGRSAENDTIRFASQVPPDASLTPAAHNREDIELDAAERPPRNRESRHVPQFSLVTSSLPQDPLLVQVHLNSVGSVVWMLSDFRSFVYRVLRTST